MLHLGKIPDFVIGRNIEKKSVPRSSIDKEWANKILKEENASVLHYQSLPS